MEDLLSSNSLILLFWIIISFIVDSGKNSYVIVIMTYIMIFIANFFDVVETFPSIFITVLALYIYFDIFCDNVKRKIMKNIGYKLVDFFYVMFFEYSFSLFLIAIFLSTSFVSSSLRENINIYLIKFSSFCVIFWACTNISSQNYLVHTFDEIKNKFDKISTYREFILKNKCIKYSDSILQIEDKNYFIRANKYTLFNTFYLKKIFHTYNLKKIVNYISMSIKNVKTNKTPKTILLRIVKFIKNIKRIMRGYSTIEMQLMRTIAIKEGYGYTFRRKTFEIIYSKLFLDSLCKYYKTCNCNTRYFKDYLLFIYTNTAKIMVDKNDVLKNIREKIKTNKDYTKEELFILTLSFSGKLRRENVFQLYNEKIRSLNLDINQLINLRNRIVN